MEQKHHYTGLTDAQVLESRRKNGANVLTPPEKEPLWKQFLEKFGDPLIIILMIAGRNIRSHPSRNGTCLLF